MLNGCPADGSSGTYRTVVDIIDGSTYITSVSDFGSGVLVDLTSYSSPKINSYISIKSSSGIGKTFYPMLRLYSETDYTYEPYTGGIASPNPSYPQEIKNVEGKNKLKTSLQDMKTNNSTGTWNDNVYSINGVTITVNPDLSLLVNGTCNAQLTFLLSNNISLEAGTYILNGIYSPNEEARIYIWDNAWGNITNTLNSTEFTINENKLIKVGINIYSGKTYNNFKISSMISANGGEYVPYNNLLIKKINKNFCKLNGPKLLMNSNGIIENANYSTTIINTKNINSLCISGDFSLLESNVLRAGGCNEYPVLGGTGTRLSNIKSSENIIDTTNYNYIMLTWVVLYSETPEKIQEIENSFQVEEGTTVTDYIAHQEKIYNFPLSQGQKLMQDGKIENKVINNRRQIVLDGSEDEQWSLRSTLTNVCSFMINALINGLVTEESKSICSHFKIIYNSEDDIEHARNGGRSYPTAFIIYIDKTRASTVAELRTWLSNNPITVEYKLETPDETEFTTDQQAVIDEIISDGTYEGVTHYTAESGINPDMEVIYYKSNT